MPATLPVRLTPRASHDEIRGLRGDGALKISVTAPPVDGRANHAMVGLLAKRLGVKRSCIGISAGTSSRDKLVQLDGISRAEALTRLGISE